MLCEKGRKCGPSDCWQSARCLCRMRRERLIRPTRFCKFNILQEVCRPDKRSASGSFVFAISLKGRESGPFLLSRDKRNCAGIPGKKAKIKLTTRALCEGNSNNGPGFANASTATAKAAAVAVEVWSTSTPGKNGAKQFSCVTPATEEVSIANATGSNVVDYPMSAVLVVAKDKTVTNVTAGDFTAPATFTVTYN